MFDAIKLQLPYCCFLGNMSYSKQVACAINCWARDGLDMVGSSLARASYVTCSA